MWQSIYPFLEKIWHFSNLITQNGVYPYDYTDSFFKKKMMRQDYHYNVHPIVFLTKNIFLA